METIFKVGDKVYDYRHGWGEIHNIQNDSDYPVRVKFYSIDIKVSIAYTLSGKTIIDSLPVLSFTEYDLTNGGLSQKRLLPNIPIDTLVYVKDEIWEMAFFAGPGLGGNGIRVFIDQNKSKYSSKTVHYSEWSLTNPLEEKENEK